MNNLKKNWHLVLITLGMMILGAVAILTATRLYQSRRVPVAPTVPGPVPAQEVNPNCILHFYISLGPTGTPTPISTLTPTPGLTTTPTPTKGLTVTSTPTGKITPTPTSKITPTPTPKSTVTPTPTTKLTTTPIPTPPLGITPTPTPTKTTTPTPTTTPVVYKDCYSVCDQDADCQGSLRCRSISGTKRCVNLSCQGEADCICNVACWQICGQDSECPSDLRCRSIDGTNRCVKTSCERNQNCDCTIAQASTPTPVGGRGGGAGQLPQAGVFSPTVFTAGVGVILFFLTLLLVI